MKFNFDSEIAASKSLMNRALILSSFKPGFQVLGQAASRDVEHMKAAIEAINTGGGLVLDCGEAGAVLRFLALRVSRIPGRHRLHGSERLFARPQEELVQILNQLGVKAQILKDHMSIEGDGWSEPTSPVKVGRQNSSQFASALLLSSWNLPFDLLFESDNESLSETYFEMSLVLCRQMGMSWRRKGHLIFVPVGSAIQKDEYRVELDLSSAFTVAALAALGGEAKFAHFPKMSLQPDLLGFQALQQMGVNVQEKNEGLRVKTSSGLECLEINLAEAPDLFPVLAVLSAFATGPSKLFGAPHLRHKESDRIQKTAELLHLAGISSQELPDGLVIHGQGFDFAPSDFEFDPDQDHRMAMAASLFVMRNPRCRVLHPEVVNKSFSGFWSLLEGAL